MSLDPTLAGRATADAYSTTSDLTSQNSALHVSVYDRSKEGEGFLGMLDIKPVLKDGYVLDNWYKLGTRGLEHVTGELWIQVAYTALRVSHFPESGSLSVDTDTHHSPRRICGQMTLKCSSLSVAARSVGSSKSARRTRAVSTP